MAIGPAQYVVVRSNKCLIVPEAHQMQSKAHSAGSIGLLYAIVELSNHGVF
jgi:hypothetical protein